jgi:type 1 glutamine amidotransferase
MKQRTTRRDFLQQSTLAGVGFWAAGSLATRADDSDQPIRALLIIGGCCHDYVKQKELIPRGVSARANVQWKVAYDPDKGTRHVNPVYANADWAKGFDVVVHDECCADVTDLKVIQRILAPHQEGLPAVLLHCGLHCYRSKGYPRVTPWFEFTGLQTTGHGPQAPIAVTYLDRDSSLTKGLQDWKTINEELYNNVTGKVLDSTHPLARGKQIIKGKDDRESTPEAIITWTNMYKSKTRVFATTLGHNNETVGDGRYLDLVTRGLLWSVGKLDDEHLKPGRKVFLEEATPPK